MNSLVIFDAQFDDGALYHGGDADEVGEHFSVVSARIAGVINKYENARDGRGQDDSEADDFAGDGLTPRRGSYGS